MERRLILVGSTPFIAGALIPVHVVMNGPALCPFRALTGLPCPLCGATRAFVLAAHLDGRFLSYGAVWVFAAAALVVTRRFSYTALALVAVIAWGWALLHAPTITS